MDFAKRQRSPARHMAGLVFVVLLHIGIVYALVSGLARKVVAVIQKPVDARLVEEIKVTPPPEPPKPPPKEIPKTAPPPPPQAYVPPPEVKVDIAPAPATIAAVVSEKPPEPAPIVREPVAPAPTPSPPAPPPAPPPQKVKVGVACPNVTEVVSDLRGKFERIAQKEGIESAEVTVEFTVDAEGNVKDARVLNSTNRAVNNLALAGVRNLGCNGQGREVKVEVPWAFKIAD